MDRNIGYRDSTVCGVAVAAALVLAACAPTPSRTGLPPESAADRSARDTTRARVVNRIPFTVHVYLGSGGTETSLGTITSFQSETYRIDHLIGPTRDVRFRGDPIGSSEVFLSSEIYVPSGETVEWTIQRP